MNAPKFHIGPLFKSPDADRQAAQQRSRDVDQHQARGDAARDRKDWREAADAYRAVLEIDENLSAIWVQYGHSLKEYGDHADAEKAYRRALEIEPNEADTHLQLGHVLKLRGELAAANAAYLRAVALDRSNKHAGLELRTFGWSIEEIRAYTGLGSNMAEECLAQTRVEKTRALIAKDRNFDPISYVSDFDDVRLLVDLRIVENAMQHYLHYGYREGRDILATLIATPPSKIFVLCPSFHKKCGIGEHARYLAESLDAAGLTTYRVRTTYALDKYSAEELKDAVVLINHGPGLFDGYNLELSEGEATSDVITKLIALFHAHNVRPICFMHSLLDRDNSIMFPRQQLWLESPIPIVTTIEAAGRVFNIWRVEHGMQPAQMPTLPPVEPYKRDDPTIGFFGFFQWGGKNFDALINIVKRLKATLVGSVATGSQYDIDKLKGLIGESEIRCDIGTGWLDDSELMERLAKADFYYLPQHDYDHWNNSGTARLVMNFHRPVILPPFNPFLDLREYAIFADEGDLPGLITTMRDEHVYGQASDRAKAYASRHPMTKEMPTLATSLHEVASSTGARNFLDDQAFNAWELLSIQFEAFKARTSYRTESKIVETFERSEPDSEARVEQLQRLRDELPGSLSTVFPVPRSVQYWRDHYELDSLFFPTMAETFVNAYRCFLKREPSLHDLIHASVALDRKISGREPTSAKDLLALLGHLWNRSPAIEFAPRVQVYHHGEPISKSDLKSQSLFTLLAARWAQRIDRLDSLQARWPQQPQFSRTNDRNIPELLMLPAIWVDDALSACAKAAGLEVRFSGIGTRKSLFERYQALLVAVAQTNCRVTQLGLIDRPIVRQIEVGRLLYSLGDFWPFEGDALIFHVVRSLCKRDPFTQEMFELGDLLARENKLSVIKAVAAYSRSPARVIDIDDPGAHAVAEAMVEKLPIILDQFRSAYAGGWDLRNFYLENRRNYDRDWLRMKAQKDIWWTQSDGDMSKIIGS